MRPLLLTLLVLCSSAPAWARCLEPTYDDGCGFSLWRVGPERRLVALRGKSTPDALLPSLKRKNRFVVCGEVTTEVMDSPACGAVAVFAVDTPSWSVLAPIQRETAGDAQALSQRDVVWAGKLELRAREKNWISYRLLPR